MVLLLRVCRSRVVTGSPLIILTPDSTQIRLASVDEVMQAKAYLCFVSFLAVLTACPTF